MARWVFDRGLPSKVTGPSLNAKTGEIAIEELHIVHEGLRLARPAGGVRHERGAPAKAVIYRLKEVQAGTANGRPP